MVRLLATKSISQLGAQVLEDFLLETSAVLNGKIARTLGRNLICAGWQRMDNGDSEACPRKNMMLRAQHAPIDFAQDVEATALCRGRKARRRAASCSTQSPQKVCLTLLSTGHSRPPTPLSPGHPVQASLLKGLGSTSESGPQMNP